MEVHGKRIQPSTAGPGFQVRDVGRTAGRSNICARPGRRLIGRNLRRDEALQPDWRAKRSQRSGRFMGRHGPLIGSHRPQTARLFRVRDEGRIAGRSNVRVSQEAKARPQADWQKPTARYALALRLASEAKPEKRQVSWKMAQSLIGSHRPQTARLFRVRDEGRKNRWQVQRQGFPRSRGQAAG